MLPIETQNDEFVCVDCGCVFQEPRRITETHGLDSLPYEEFSVCPKCGGSYVPVKRCDHCSEYITDGYVEIADGKRYCEECFTLRNLWE